MKHLLILLAILLLAGCASSEKGIWIRDSVVMVFGNIKPELKRDGTTENQDVKPDVKPDIKIPFLPEVQPCANSCHNAYAGDLFRGIQLPDLPDEPDKPPVVDPVEPPVVEPVEPPKPPPATNQITETCKRNGKGDKNPGWITYYCGHKYEYYPKQITIELPSGKKWTANLGGMRSDRPGEVGQFVKGQYVVKKSSSNGRLAVLPARKFVAPAPWEPAIKIHYTK